MTPSKVVPDWFRFRTQAAPLEALDGLRGMFGCLGKHLTLRPLAGGMDGFRSGAEIRLDDQWCFGRMDFGGESQRGWVRVNVTGTGCSNVSDWDALADVEALPAAEIRRLDLALTTWRREVLHDDVVAAHSIGRFRCSGMGGRPPSLEQVTSSDPRAGRTCYVGKRESDKFFRGYEKGFEMLAKSGGHSKLKELVTSMDGFPLEDIYRCEVELKAKGTVIPWETVERRDQYFAGSYPFLGDLLPGVEADILQRRPEREPQTQLAVALANCKIQYGTTLFTALTAYGGDFMRVWADIVGGKHNEQLIAGGVLQVEHPDKAWS